MDQHTANSALISIAGRDHAIAYRRGDPYGDHFAQLGRYSEHIGNFILEEIKKTPKPVVLDLGANIGLTSLFIANSHPEVSLVALEPSPETFLFLLQNTHNTPNIRTLPLAVGAANSTVRFGSSRTSASGSFCLEETAPQLPGICIEGEISVPCLTLDHLVHALQITSIAVIKVDVEGFEENVLLGARKILESLNPIWVIEFNPWVITNICKKTPEAFLRYVLGLFGSVESLSRRSQGKTSLISLEIVSTYIASIKLGVVDDLICRVHK